MKNNITVSISFETLSEAYSFVNTGFIGFDFDKLNIAIPNTYGAVVSFIMQNDNESVLALLQKVTHEGGPIQSMEVNGESIAVYSLTEVGDSEATYDHHYNTFNGMVDVMNVGFKNLTK